MDVGVGSFVFSLGLVASKSHSRNEQKKFGLSDYLAGLASSLRRSVPMLVLGLVRVLMVKGTEYPVSLLVSFTKLRLIDRNTSPSMACIGTSSSLWVSSRSSAP
jgi:hypothetical protein